MSKSFKFLSLLCTVAMMFIAVSAVSTVNAAPAKAPAKAAPAKAATANVDTKKCFECHDTVQMLHTRGQHKGVNCVNCHQIPAKHIEDPNIKTRPVTRFDWQACGACHKDQMDSFLKLDMHRPARNEKSNVTGRAPNPFWDKLMAGHGFTKEHAVTRSHSVMLVDQFVVDRAFGGRFQPINGWNYIFQTGKVWDILKDTHPEVAEQKAFLAQTATANNPVCMNCKTFDHILDWSFMGDPGTNSDPAMNPKWSRLSNPVAMAKSMNHALNCFTCHDPHSAEPRIVRDALIDAMVNPEWSDNLIQKDPKKPQMEVITMGQRGFERKIAIFKDKNDPKRATLQCAQCHVEYNCNPGTNLANGEPLKFASRLTNHFPMKDALNLYDHYFNKIKFQDFTNRFSGAPLWKAQHPEAETFYMSKHSMAGISCANCHFAPATQKNGKKFTSHFATSPRFMIEQTCLSSDCHGKGADKKWSTKKYSKEYIAVSTNWDKVKAEYSIDSIKSYIRGKMRKSEFWLVELTDAIRDAKRANLPDDVIKAAQLKQSEAHVLWEYWTAENSDGFHNPELAKESLTKSISVSMDGYKLIEDAFAAKK